ncbi:MAG: hypothetical protein II343_03490 [Clostridia bacterium]|nr:hypothetical protein [Clostridia bacterium]
MDNFVYNLCTLLKSLDFPWFFLPLLVDSVNGDNVDKPFGPPKRALFDEYFGKKHAQKNEQAENPRFFGRTTCPHIRFRAVFPRSILVCPPAFPPAQKPKKRGATRGFGTYPLIHRPYYYYDIYYSATAVKGL